MSIGLRGMLMETLISFPEDNTLLDRNFKWRIGRNIKAGSSVIDFDGDGLNEFVIPHASINDYWKQIGFAIYGNTVQGIFGYNLQRSSEMPVYATGDFNNDGKGEIVFFRKRAYL